MRCVEEQTDRLKGAVRRQASALRARRRATVMIFVLGILSLLALIGMVLITRTHGEFRRVAEQSASSSSAAVRDGVVRKVREVLRLDIWGAAGQVGLLDSGRPLTNITPPGSTKNSLGLLENNEPWDSPGESDRWLASLTPYPIGRIVVNNDLANPPPVFENDVLVWRYVSYLGSDINLPKDDSGVPINPFMWAQNYRLPDSTPSADTLVRYDASSLSNVQIIQTPSPLFVGPLIAGSTTNATIRAARAFWNSPAHQTLLADQLTMVPQNASLLANLVPQFPYFDTNSDGAVDLYDADGDGVPDSPISFIVETDSPDPDRPRQLYAVVRIVDHAAMTNVNTSSALTRPSGALTFHEGDSDLQRRGRRATEYLMDEAVHRDDWFLGANRTANLASYRSNGVLDPITLDQDVVRRTLIGGLPGPTGYNLYGPDDEASLRHRGMLVPYDRRDDRTAAAGDARTIDRALRGSLLWSRLVNPSGPPFNFSYTGTPRWSRMNANFGSANYEGTTFGNNIGWRNFLDPDEPFAARRPLLTTVNIEVMPPPDITKRTVAGQPADRDIDLRLRQLWALGMNWPVLIGQSSSLLSDPNIPAEPTLIDDFTVLDNQVPAEWARVQPIDLNMGTTDSANLADIKNDFLRYTATAMYLALDGLDKYQGMPLTQALGGTNALLNREYLAWQFAANLEDYRDSDNVPTIIEWPTQPGRFIFGVEKQPFFTEAYAHLTVPDANSTTGDKWFFAFELYVPPGWKIFTNNLYFRDPSNNNLIPLNTFSNSIGAATEMDGGPADVANVALADDHGKYFVFANDPDLNEAPLGIRFDPNFRARVYINSAANPLSIPTDGHGRLELVYSPSGTPGDAKNHVLDVIGPTYSGGDLTGKATRIDGSGDGFWAMRPPGMGPATPGGRPATQAFSLRRSTKGWRFTTCWHVYAENPVVVGHGSPGGSPFGVSLGKPNAALNELSDSIPESIWPAITTLDNGAGNPDREPFFLDASGTLVRGFQSGLPFEAFDSVADLGRMFMIGPVNLSPRPPLPALPVLLEGELSGLDLPVTALIAATISRDIRAAPGDLPARNIDRVAAGRVDFMPSGRSAGSSPPWTWRLFDYLTTQSHLFDGIDNDGDGSADLSDPTEAADVLFRTAGRVNLNTAPVSVLRSGPFMSLLPTSAELNFFDPTTPVNNPALSFQNSAAGFYYDFASAVVAIREDRNVPVRLLNTTTSLLEPVAIAELPDPNFVAKPTATQRGAFAQVIELAELATDRRHLTETLNSRDDMFQIDRFWANNLLALPSHIVRFTPPNQDPLLGPPDGLSSLSPDFRYRGGNNTTDYVPIQHVVGPPLPLDDAIDSDPFEAGGIRGRDVFLSRWTNVFSTRSDCFTAYIALLDEDGNIVQRSQVTLDRSVCFREIPPTAGRRGLPILPRILVRSDGSYADDTK